jgi:hypothetical protein
MHIWMTVATVITLIIGHNIDVFLYRAILPW